MLWVRFRVRARVRGDTSKPGSGSNMSSHLIRDRGLGLGIECMARIRVRNRG